MDAAVYDRISERIRLQVNVENPADLNYFSNAGANTNLTPGYPRAPRAGLIRRY